MKKIISIICCSICCGIAAAQGTYGLDQLKQLAVENNYNLRSARNAIQQSKEVKSEALPSSSHRFRLWALVSRTTNP